jgi:preprotein translocase subunit SecB
MTDAGDAEGRTRDLTEDAGEIPQFGYQLVDVYLHDCSVVRRELPAEGPERPTFATGIETRDREEPPGFTAILTVEAKFRFRPEAFCEVESRTAGVFVRVGELAPEDDQRFREIDCAVLLWPYARATVGEIVRMTGLELPPLPTVDVRATLSNTNPTQA